jgi:hypothetical protein
MKYAAIILVAAFSLLPAMGQGSPKEEATQALSLVESGKILVDGRATPYLIRRLPLSSFPKLPDAIADGLNARGCMIPQTYSARRPENVVQASLEKAGSSDWAVLCSVKGTVTLLVFFASAPEKPTELASALETQSLQVHDSSGVLGFNWAIDPASPQRIREAQAAMEHHPPLLDHDALADTILEKGTIYHFYIKNAWTQVEMPE